MAKQSTLSIFGRTVVWDGLPLGGEVRAYDEALRSDKGEVHIIYALAVAILNLRQPASAGTVTPADLDGLPFSGQTTDDILTVIDAIREAMAGKKATAALRQTTQSRMTGGASGPPSAVTTP